MKLHYFCIEAWTPEVGVLFGQMSTCLVLPMILNSVDKSSYRKESRLSKENCSPRKAT